MSKKRKKSRFIKSDVNAICELQRKVEIYESYIVALAGYVQHRGEKQFVCLLGGTEIDDIVNQCWCELNDVFGCLDAMLKKSMKEFIKSHDEQEAERPQEG
jgi:hypothetical protein